jgi:hypothetical protein
MKRVRQEHGNGGRGAKAGENADEGAHEHADKAEKEVHRSKANLGTQQDVIQEVHGLP